MLDRQPARILLAHISTSGRPAQAEGSSLSPLERNQQSSKGWKKSEADGVGLAIVTSLEKPDQIAHRPSKIVIVQKKSAPKAAASPSMKPPTAARDFPVADFLSSCNLCSTKLHGKDIFMYRGEMAFCSIECRYQQIVSDECLEKCGPGAFVTRSEMSSPPCSGGHHLLFSAGITAV